MTAFPFPPTLPPNTIVGRLGIGPGPAEAIPFLATTRLTANLNFYVRTDGNDTNSGTINSAIGAWQTIQHATDYVKSLNFNGFSVTINVAPGTYTINGLLPLGDLIGAFGGTVHILGDTTTPSNVVVNFSPSGGFYCTCGPWQWDILGLKISTASGDCVDIDGGFLTLGKNEWGTCTSSHINVHNNGVSWEYGSDTISGGGTCHWSCQSDSLIRHRGTTITLTGTPNFSQAFVLCDIGTLQMDGINFSGAATGVRGIFTDGARAQLNTDNLTYFPGDQAVQLNSGASYNRIQGPLATKSPTTQTADYAMTISDASIIFNKGSSATLTLLSAATYAGRQLLVKTITAQTVISNASNVVPLIGGGAGTAILAATAGKWALLQSDATNWVIMAGN